MLQLVDSTIKLLEVDREYVYKTDIPLLRAEVLARLANINHSRMRSERFNEVDVFTKEDYYGMKAVTTALNSLFGGKGKEDKPRGAINARSAAPPPNN